MLLFDLGNSRMKVALYEKGKIQRVATHQYKSKADLVACIEQLNLSPDKIILASVTRQYWLDTVNEACERKWGLKPIELTTRVSCCDITNLYDSPEQLGIDRWAVIIAGYRLAAGAALVVDCGSATTADIVNEQGEYLGGAIIPGAELMKDALNSKTVDIVTGNGHLDTLSPGLNTMNCVNLGAVQAQCGFIDRMCLMAKQVTATDKIRVILTGGGASELLPYLPGSVCHEKELVFLGMAGMVAQKG